MVNKDKLASKLLDLFFNRYDAYGIETESGWRTCKGEVNNQLIKGHLNGSYCLGAHEFGLDETCKWIAWDVDETVKAKLIYDSIKPFFPKESICFYHTGGRGYRITIFFKPTLQFNDAYWLIRNLTPKPLHNSTQVELYPKSSQPKEFGYFTRLPCGYHFKHKAWAKLINPKTILEIKPYNSNKMPVKLTLSPRELNHYKHSISLIPINWLLPPEKQIKDKYGRLIWEFYCQKIVWKNNKAYCRKYKFEIKIEDLANGKNCVPCLKEL